MVIKRAKPVDGSTKVTFVVSLSECDQPVSVVGDFNDWDPLATPLRRRSNGTQSASVEVAVGATYRFKYLAEGGRWFCDSEAACDGERYSPDSNSVLEL